ncbi:MAG: ferric reductase-like transmembrane domain-containing protein [Pseudomonadota bacterium]
MQARPKRPQAGNGHALRRIAVWLAIVAAIAIPLGLAVASPFLAYRGPAYIMGGFAGIIALCLLLLQPLIAGRYLPGLRPRQAKSWHVWVGAGIVSCVILHVVGLYVTSPPDTLDALLLVSPTPFSVYGVTAMWGVALTVLLVVLRRRLPLRYGTWRLIHNVLAFIVVVATVVHALQIEGAMEPVSKWALCLLVLIVTAATLIDLRVIKPRLQKRRSVQSPVGD